MSKKREKGTSLSEKLSSLIHTKPPVVESDNDDDLTTVDKIAVNENDSEYSADELEVSKFRKINEKFLDEEDDKYKGKGISRKDLDNDDSVDSDFSEAKDTSKDDLDDSFVDSDSEVQETDDEDNVTSEDSDSPVPDEAQNDKLNGKKQNDDFNNEIFAKATSDIAKGKDIKNQLHIWDFLLECRMKFQKCLVASNQLPNYKNFNKFKNEGGEEYQGFVSQCKSSLRHLLHSLLSLQEALLKSNEDFLSFSVGATRNKNVNKEDEEIESDTENEEEDNKKCKTKTVNYSAKKLKNLDNISLEIGKRHKDFENYRNHTIQKWNDKTKIGYISNKNFSAFEQSTLKQIEHVLLDKQRLIKRTQMKRSSYHILGEEDCEPPVKTHKFENDPLTNSGDVKGKDLQKEIFDDDDFYHQLLNELVKRKANDVTDPVQLGRQWMQLQKIRSKMKKTVDVKASKGRKVRFVVHPKLVNFMMPINNSYYSEDSNKELFNSLFGKNKN